MSNLKLLEIGMNNGSALLERLGSDAPPNQFIRELYKNAEEAGATQIKWDLDWPHYQLLKLAKLSIIDDGIGMTGDELVERINKLASSSHGQSLEGNYGIGAKLSTFPRNPHGTIYLSRKDGVNYQVRFEKDLTKGIWGLRQFEMSDGSYEYYTTVEDSVMPKLIQEKGHGTAVILLGDSEEDNTLLPPETNKFGKSNWIVKELNSRIYKVPDNLSVKVNKFKNIEEGVDSRNSIVIRGNGYFLDRFNDAKGIVEHPNGKIHWFIVKKNQLGENLTGVYVTTGHAGLLYQNEIYDLRLKGKGTRMLHNFGIKYNTSRIVIYVEPNSNLSAIPNSVRTELMVDGKSFPWEEFANTFKQNMPQEIIDLERKTAESNTKNIDQSSILKNLKSIYPTWLKVSRYKPSDIGEFITTPTGTGLGGQRERSVADTKSEKENEKEDIYNEPKSRKSSGNTNGGTGGSLYELFQTKSGVSAVKKDTMLPPKIYWVSKKDGSRSDDDGLEDRAAIYIRSQHSIKANADFRVFRDTEKRFIEKYKWQPKVTSQIPSIVRKWYTQQLMEVLLRADQLRNSKMWVGPCMNILVSEEALTCAMLPVYNLLQQIDAEIKETMQKVS